MDENNKVYSKARVLYHVVLVSKFSRRLIFRQVKKDIEMIVSELCMQRNVEIVEMKSFSGSFHLLVYLPPKLSTSDFMIFLNSESTKLIFQIYSNPKYLDGKSLFWGKSYFATMVEKDKKSKFLNIRD